MASQTTYYNLDKPGYGESADIAVINGNMDKIANALHSHDETLTGNKPIRCTKSGVNALPTTITKEGITDTMQCVKLMLTNQYAQAGDWTITSASGTVTISGDIVGSTDIELWMQEVRT